MGKGGAPLGANGAAPGTNGAALAGARALVTGGAGFLGANLARHLADAGTDVHVLVRPSTARWRLAGLTGRVQVHVVDLLDASAVADVMTRLAPRLVFHLAAAGGHAGDPDARRTALATGVAGTFNVLAALGGNRDVQRLVHVGSFLEYGPRVAALTERDALAPTTFRGAVKAASTLLCQQAAREGVPVVTLRAFSIYGPWEQSSRLVPTAIRSALTGRPLSLTAIEARHDFVYVDDVVRACIQACWSDGVVGEAINIGSGVETSNRDLVRAVERAVGRPVVIDDDGFPAPPSDTPHCLADVEKARLLLGWRPDYDLASGLACTVRWQREALARTATSGDSAAVSATADDNEAVR